MVGGFARRLPGRIDTSRGARPGPRETNASATPLWSRLTRLDARERNATQRGRRSNTPPTAGGYDAPFAGLPPRPRERRRVLSTRQRPPLLPIRPARRTAKSSVRPLRSSRTMFDARDWNAMIRAKRLSPEITPWVDGAFGVPPRNEREISFVCCVRAAVTVGAAAGAPARPTA